MGKLLAIVVGLIFVLSIRAKQAPISAELVPLANVLPKLQVIHEDTKTLLAKNIELRPKILAGLQVQEQAKSRAEPKPTNGANQQHAASAVAAPPHPPPSNQPKPAIEREPSIDYSEIDDFNKWVEVNLEYAVKNTRESIETLKEEAQQNGGSVDYSEQAIKDGIEGVKYWQQALIFQDKTLKNEKYDAE